MNNAEIIEVGNFKTRTCKGHNYRVVIFKNGRSVVKVSFGPSGLEQNAANLGLFLFKLKQKGILISYDIDWEKIKELTGKDHFYPLLESE